jgi:hypothetical protein
MQIKRAEALSWSSCYSLLAIQKDAEGSDGRDSTYHDSPAEYLALCSPLRDPLP